EPDRLGRPEAFTCGSVPGHREHPPSRRTPTHSPRPSQPAASSNGTVRAAPFERHRSSGTVRAAPFANRAVPPITRLGAGRRGSGAAQPAQRVVAEDLLEGPLVGARRPQRGEERLEQVAVAGAAV